MNPTRSTRHDALLGDLAVSAERAADAAGGFADRHFELAGLTLRLRFAGEAMVAEARGAGARVEPTGVATGRRMCPVLVFGAPGTARLLQEEIFGPVLPIVTYDSEEQALAFIRERPRPLAFYLFDNDDRRARHTLTRVVSGGACINDTLVHFAQENLPFGGVGQSGMGAYHGETGFKTFSHSRSVLSAAASPAQRVLAPPWGRVAEAAIQVAISRLGRLL